MDLWIRSQDKNLIIKCNSVGLDENSIQVNFEDGVGFIVAEYKTKERSLEVLGEIQRELADGNNADRLIFSMPKE